MLHTDIRHDLVRSFYRPITGVTAAEVEAVFKELEAEGSQILQNEGVGETAREFIRTADMRYVGQEYFVNISIAGQVDEAVFTGLPERFHAAYLTRYGHSNPEEAIEFVNLRISAVGHLSRQAGAAPAEATSRPIQAQERRQVIFGREPRETQVFYRVNLQPGDAFSGPAIVEEPSCTTVIPPDYGAAVDSYGNIVITRQGVEHA
ncbi:MAG: hypothetical protein U0401_18560 [Anaerolineae bacterium]